MSEINSASITPNEYYDLPFFEFDDNHIDKVFRLGPISIDKNVVSFEFPMRQLREDLFNGESVRLPSFSVNPLDPCLGAWRFELRLYPSGQFFTPDWFSVYLVLIECPDGQDKYAGLNVSLTVRTVPQKIVFQDNKFKTFDWTCRSDRWVRLGVPLSHIKYRRTLSITLTIKSDYNMMYTKQMQIKEKSPPKLFRKMLKDKNEPMIKHECR